MFNRLARHSLHEFDRLIVDPQFQRRGIGTALLTHAESVFPSAVRYELFTGSRSVRNIALYEKHGYARFREETLSPAVSLIYMQKFRNDRSLDARAPRR